MKVPRYSYRIPDYYGDNDWHIDNVDNDSIFSLTNPLTSGIVRLSGQWIRMSTSSYDQSVISEAGAGYFVVKSNSNYHVSSGVSYMYIDITSNDILTFKAMARSEINYDYVVVQLDGSTIFNGKGVSSFSSFTVSNAAGKTLTIYYRKDGSADNDQDRGYLAIPDSFTQIED